ncbi:uncharacterized protein LOC131840767 isoform X2 [Achroia grisella]|uniref:uncharacterized protein LOC131840767 isoform X2 n=1 Tax=Achroia grisella TaxID=688607 RepID=UPI0027D29FE8|nr:uncharacterized protein LOC131840767 isoform X2 [Achroia grisella]
MDDTQQSKTSEAAATRKRRSSILKSHRPPRTPFTELEFNVATPTDSAKSRRVSFSRRTGVAEFVTNEATTTWKNFYEEHNKSLESSGNDSKAHAPRPPIGHIGKRIFDQQFEEVDAVDFLTSLDTLTNKNISSTINNANFTEQLSSLESSDNKLPIPNNNFELSAFTEHHSKVFGDDLVIPTMGEMSGKIDVNFSTVQTIGGDEKDDLDEIQRDLQKNNKNIIVGPQCFKGDRDMSEYIEVDLNMTHVNLRNEESDMSITDTIRCPKVQDVSKSGNSSQIDVKTSFSNKDWLSDKENIAINPYITPKESLNFAINDESDKVLVFDGKRLTIQSDKEADDVLSTKERSSHGSSDKAKRKTVVINVNDDLPNFGDVSSYSVPKTNVSQYSMLLDDDDLSLTQGNNVTTSEKRKTILYEENAGNISVTQVVPSNIIITEKNNSDRRRTVVYENDTGNISITQAISSNIILATKKEATKKRRTIVYENDTGNISITQALPSNIMSQYAPDKRKTIIYENDLGNISMTQAIPTNILASNIDKNKTLNYDNLTCDISMTQGVPSNLLLATKAEERRRTVIFESETGNISVTQAIPSNVILTNNTESEKMQAVMYSDDIADISLTQPISDKVTLPKTKVNEKRRTVIYENDTGNISVTQAVPSNIILNQRKTIVEEVIKTHQVDVSEKLIINDDDLSKQSSFIKDKRTIVFENDESDISMTQTISTKLQSPTLIFENKKPISYIEKDVTSQLHSIPTKIESTNKRRTIVYENDTGNISVTQAVPTNILLLNIQETKNNEAIVHDNNPHNIFIVQHNYNNLLSEEENEKLKKQNEMSDNDKEQQDSNQQVVIEGDSFNADMSITTVVPHKFTDNSATTLEKTKINVFVDETPNLSMTQSVSPKLIDNQNEILDPSKSMKNDEKMEINHANVDVFIYQAISHTDSAPKLQTGTEEGDSKLEESASVINNYDKTMYSYMKLENANDQLEGTEPTIKCKDKIDEVVTQNIADVQVMKTKDIEETHEAPLSSTLCVESQTQSANGVAQTDEPVTKSILTDLLDMSDASMESRTKDQNSMTEKLSIDRAIKDETESSSSDIFFIIKDDEQGSQTDKIINDCSNLSTVSRSDVASVKSPDIVSSFTSSKNHMDVCVREQDSVTTTSSNAETVSSDQREYQSLWRPEVPYESSGDVNECDSSVNVVAKINMLPFMGSHECEWDASGTDIWSFRLMHGRLRLTVRLEHRHHNSTRTWVRADTPVISTSVETTNHANDSTNSVARLCVVFAAEAMRYTASGGCGRAGEVPALVRRCAAAARVALRWGRAMHHARLRLAYTLSDDGCLALKVANIPMRCVWEVRMRLELVVDRGGRTPWPRAGQPTVSCVLSGGQPPPEQQLRRLLHALGPGWGHVPTAVWKIFKYLKHKTSDDYLLGI